MTTRRVVCTPGTCGGSPRIEGTRLTCANVVQNLAYQAQPLEEFVMEKAPFYDSPFTTADVRNALEYCASQQCLHDQPMNYCQACTHSDGFPGEEPDERSDLWRFAAKVLATLDRPGPHSNGTEHGDITQR